MDYSPSWPLLHQSWSHDSLVADFVTNIIPPADSNRYCVFSWLRDTITWTPVDAGVTRLAVSALATGWAGRVELRPDLIVKGLQMYTSATQQLRRDLSEARPPQMLATTAAFALYELFEFGSQDNNGWQYHIAGAAASVQASSEVDLSMGPNLQILDFFRAIFVRLSSMLHNALGFNKLTRSR